MDRVTDTHVYFWGDTTFSNWGDAEFDYKGEHFYNSEQAFMWEKAIHFGDEIIAGEILSVGSNPSVAKKLGRKVMNFNANEWFSVSYDTMVAVCLAKFEQNPGMLNTLRNTGNKTMVEASPYDKIWGVGMHWNDDAILDEANWAGLNLLGKALMDVRAHLK